MLSGEPLPSKMGKRIDFYGDLEGVEIDPEASGMLTSILEISISSEQLT